MTQTYDHLSLDERDETDSVEPLAIVGMAVRAPGAGSVEEFWRNLVEARESVTFFTEEEQREFGVSEDDLEHPTWVAAAPIVDDARDFDGAAFGMSDREVLVMDPQHRMFLEVSRTAFDDAGYDPGRYAGTIGVYGGTGATNYQWQNLRANAELWDAVSGQLSISTANSPDYLATQVSYRMNLRGPAMTVMTACSTSLVAVHLAAEAIRAGECDMAIAGGACVELPYGHGYVSMEGYTSPDGHCRPFDADAQGTLWGSGAGAILIKRLSDAIADGDRIRGVIRGNAINNDGSNKVGFSAPSVEGQVGALTAAVAVSGIDPTSVGYVEAHGTGTALGDPVEVAALSQVYGRGTDQRQWCAIGSVKSNIGHLSQAAGIVGLIKATLTVESGLIPPTLHFRRANPAIDFAQTPFTVADSLRRFETDGGPRRAGVSSFGIGGTNAHIIVEQPPATSARREVERPELVQLSAYTASALESMVERTARYLGTTRASLADVATTLRVGRPALQHRLAVAVEDLDDAAEALLESGRVTRGEVADAAPSVALMFSGQGAQYPGMAKALADREPVFAESLQECLEQAAPAVTELVLQPGDASSAASLGQTENTQPALFAVEYALARLWQSWGVDPDVLVGHSIGEFVAAAISGVMAPSDAMRLVVARGRLMQTVAPGVMLSVLAEETDVADVIERGGHAVDVAAVNGPGAVVVSGAADAVDALVADLDRAGLPYRPLKVSHAFHSRLMEPILAEFRELVAAVELHGPGIPVLSNVTGTWLTEAEATDPDYWARHLRGTVRFADDLETLLAEGSWALLECGPGAQLTSLARLQGSAAVVTASLPGPRDHVDAGTYLLRAAGELWCAGVAVEVPATGQRVGMPTYPYERVRHWADYPGAGATTTAADTAGGPPSAPPVAGAETVDRSPRRPHDWFAAPVWRELAPLLGDTTRSVLLLGGTGSAGAALHDALTHAGATVSGVASDDLDALALEPGTLVVDARALSHPEGTWDEVFLPALALLQRLSDEEQAEVVLLSTGAAGPYGDASAPAQASLAGLARVVPQESPHITVRLVDVDEPSVAAARELLIGEAPEVTLRGGRRWVREFSDVRLDGDVPTVLPEVAVVTGGLGGIGLVVAEDLARLGVPRVQLLSRSGLPDRSTWDDVVAREGATGRHGRAILTVRRMQAHGTQVDLPIADISDADAITALRRELGEARIGLVHAAGLPGGGMVAVKQEQAVRDVMTPKLTGAMVLQQAFADADLAWVVLCSSVTGTVGGVGQVDYCAANAALDAMSEQPWGRAGVRPVSVGWGGWSEVGMAAEADPSAPTGSVTEAPVEHPLLTRRDQTSVFGTASPAADWLLDEHRIEGTPVIPGTAHVAHAVRAAQELLPGEGAIELTDVLFRSPFAVADDAAATVRVVIDRDGSVLVLGEQLAGTQVHATARAARRQQAAPAALDLAALRDSLSPVTDAEGDGGRESLVQFGPRWDAVVGRWSEPGVRDLAEIRLPGAGAAAEAAAWGLHPATLDVATSFGFGHASGPFLPLGYGTVRVYAPLPEHFWSVLSYEPDTATASASESAGGGTVSATVTLVDDSGRVLVDIEDYTLRRVTPGVVDRADDDAEEQQRSSAQDEADLGPRPTGIRPMEGARALRRVLTAGLSGSVIVTPKSVAAILAPEPAATDDVAADGTAAGESDAPTGSDAGGAPSGQDEGTELERSIAAIWSKVLGVPEVGPRDDFFALGGNSLVAVQLVAEIRRATKVKLPMKALFEMPTVAQVAKGVEALRADAAAAPTIPTIERN